MAATAHENRFWLRAAILAATLFSGCAIRQTRPPVPLSPPGPQDVDVFYVTDRAQIVASSVSCKPGEQLQSGPRFSGDRQPEERMNFGTFAIHLPGAAPFGKLVKYKPRLLCARVPQDPVFLKGPTALEEDAFFREMAARLGASPGAEVFVFVHGFRYSFEESVLWTAQLKQNLSFSGDAVVFAWPSQGSSTGYAADEESIEWSAPHVQQFLERLLAALPGRRIHLLAHSMGTRAVVTALNHMAAARATSAAPLFGNVVLAAPDIVEDVFRQRISAVIRARLAERVTLYGSQKDKALGVSGRLHLYPREGDLEYVQPLLAGLDVVDVTPADKSSYYHNYLFENRWVLADLFLLLHDNLPPAQRFGLIPLSNPATPSLLIWQLRP